MPPQTRYARCDELSIAYQVIGDGQRDLLIVPAWLWHIELLWNDPGYHRFMRGLTDLARVIAYDKRGTGMSDPVSAPPSLDERMDDVLAVLDAAGSERATVLGVSEGGAIGVVFAASHPERTERLILYGSPVCGAYKDGCPAAELTAKLHENLMGSLDRWGEGVNVAWIAPSIDGPTARRFAGLLERGSMSPAMARANMAANGEIDVRPVLASVAVPTLVLHRRDDAGALTSQILCSVKSPPSEVWGVDASPAFVERARSSIPDARAHFETGAAEALPFEREAFDVVVSGLLVNFVADPASAIREMVRVARPAAVVASYVWDYLEEMQMLRYFWDAVLAQVPAAAELEEVRRFAICRPRPLSALFDEEGLEDVEVEAIDIQMRFSDFDDYWSPFRAGQGAAPGYLVSLPHADRLAIEESLRSTLPRNADASIDLVARAWAVRGRLPQ